jgi:hypothetical protein
MPVKRKSSPCLYWIIGAFGETSDFILRWNIPAAGAAPSCRLDDPHATA